MERKCWLRVTAGGKLLATVEARPFGSDLAYIESEFDVTTQWQGIYEAAERVFRLKSPPEEMPKTNEAPPDDGCGDP